MTRRNLTVRLWRFTSRSRRPVTPCETRIVSRQRERGMRRANVSFTPPPETRRRATLQPRASFTVRRRSLGPLGVAVVVGGRLAVAGAPAEPVVGGGSGARAGRRISASEYIDAGHCPSP
jgi:hypothetical protein